MRTDVANVGVRFKYPLNVHAFLAHELDHPVRIRRCSAS